MQKTPFDSVEEPFGVSQPWIMFLATCSMLGIRQIPGICISASSLQSPSTLTVVTNDRILDLRDFIHKAV